MTLLKMSDQIMKSKNALIVLQVELIGI